MLGIHKSILIFLSFLGTFSIVGTGFCVWTFNEENNISKSKGIGIEVTQSSDLGTFYIGKIPTFILLEEGNHEFGNLMDGIVAYKYELNETTNTQELVKDDAIEIVFNENKDISSSVSNVEIGIRLSINGAISEYITLVDSYNASLNQDGIYVLNNHDTYQYDEINKVHNVTIYLTEYLRYISEEIKPNTLEKYQELHNKVFGSGEKSTIKLDFVASIG